MNLVKYFLQQFQNYYYYKTPYTRCDAKYTIIDEDYDIKLAVSSAINICFVPTCSFKN